VTSSFDPGTPAPAPAPRFGLSRPVWLLGWVSFFNDAASEIVYPLLPLFLTRVLGAGAMSLGIVEGVAEAANSVLKIASGWIADRSRVPRRLVLGGYALSSAVRPLMGLVTAWPHVLVLRFTDRVGKGIRGAPRDAMLASFADPSQRGRVFGFNRAMDHAGAVVGPLAAAAFLYRFPDQFRTLFTLSILPGIIVILVLLQVPSGWRSDADRAAPAAGTTVRAAQPLPSSFYRAMIVIALFSLGNASDAFLLLRLSDVGFSEAWIPFLWAMLHVVKVATSLAGGELSDRLGRRQLIGAGWIIYALVYAGFAVFDAKWTVLAIFLSYGTYFGLTEGVEKAWVTDLVPHERRGTAFGIYNAVLGVGSLAASVLFGALWTRVSPEAAFFTGAALALAGAVLLIIVPAGEARP
jgi:MFS family permease